MHEVTSRLRASTVVVVMPVAPYFFLGNSGDISVPPHHPPHLLAKSAPPCFEQQARPSGGSQTQVRRSELGAKDRGVDPRGVARVLDVLPGEPEVHIVLASHVAFFPPCSPELAANLPRFCTDPAGFDRAAFHRDFAVGVAPWARKQPPRHLSERERPAPIEPYLLGQPLPDRRHPVKAAKRRRGSASLDGMAAVRPTRVRQATPPRRPRSQPEFSFAAKAPLDAAAITPHGRR
jgi:hypothetical protein